MIYTAYYYPGSLDKGDLIIRDNRFYPGKYFETFPVWMQYVRKHYPDEHIVMFADAASPVPISEGIKHLDEPYEIFVDELNMEVKLHIKIVSEHSNKYFWAMQRNLVMGLTHAWESHTDFFWLDNDAFLNTNLSHIFKEVDAFAPQINHYQFTCDSVCMYYSKKRLHEADYIYNLPSYLYKMVNDGPTETRMHCLQESGLYKMFCYGKMAEAPSNLNLSHLSCYDNFMKFLKRNPLPTLQYINLVMKLENFDFGKITGVDLKFHDMYYEEV